MTRVVVTGLGAVTALGSDWSSFSDAVHQGRSGIRVMHEWADIKGLNTQLGGPVDGFQLTGDYPRKKIRSMGRVSQLATVASRDALLMAGLLDDPLLTSGRTGIAYGSSTGSTDAAREFAQMLTDRDLTRITATTYIKMMSHTTAVNLGVFFEIKGRVYPTSSACTSGSQAIGYAYEAIASGRQDIMLAGGAEELCPTEAAVFDTFRSASTKNDTPNQTPSPFDAKRDGLVIGEGAGSLILESLEHAQARGADIYGEVVGFGTNSDGGHVTQPDSDSMQVTMQLALKDAGLQTSDIDYLNAHGTATQYGDVTESQASYAVFQDRVPVSSCKGHLGHSLGAGGAIEAWACLHMMRDGWVMPTLNLNQVDANCAPLQYVMGGVLTQSSVHMMSNNFAFGGINTSLIFKRYDG
ncbi:beta-ketoacyl-ACP synthase [Gilvimarinus sp. 1_MG-2023]|uniref:beta-ketoacyl-ACP synthase n=1 Tax=Gilvimarinus sp. 1_MG-2023 TaxID=3062638 RepID=UPI0026E475E0|nr:beta-ketoacyl-ACP synthase [Gilvimarinus sp. 1_MG-2023]MDO6748487.1 beta-ketoacyl-ACP synthase [Gilvimarinus sp. 1_MG-2023]